MFLKCMAAVSMMVSTIVPVSQSCSGSKKLSKIYGTKLYEEGNTGKACNFSSGCDIGIGSECPYIADSVGGCYCNHGLCYWISGFGTWFGSPEGDSDFELPGENRCSDYTDCECR